MLFGQVRLTVFSSAVKIFFGQTWLSPLEKIGPYAYVNGIIVPLIFVTCHVQNAEAVGCVIVDPVTDTLVAASNDQRLTNSLDHAVMLCIAKVAECQRPANNSSR